MADPQIQKLAMLITEYSLVLKPRQIVCNLRNGGEIFVGGELIQKNGRFLDKRFPRP